MKTIYLIEDGHGRLKIGITSTIAKRLTMIKTGCSEGVKQVLVSPKIANAFQLEQEAHKAFAQSRTSGEWFTMDIASAVSYFSEAHRVSFVKHVDGIRGGAKPGAGRKHSPKGHKKLVKGIRLAEWIWAWLDTLEEPRGVAIEKALMQVYSPDIPPKK